MRTPRDAPLEERLRRYDRWIAEGRIPFSSRVIPVRESLAALQWVLPTDQVLELLRNARSFALTECTCRTHYGRCDHPLETCFLLNDAADAHLAQGSARRLSLKEAEGVARQANERGLVHLTVYNPEQYVYAICSCCPCCCHDLQFLQVCGRSDMVARSEYVAETEAAACLHCGECVARCVFGARTWERDRVRYDPAACYGCGLCVTVCPAGATTMARRQDQMSNPGIRPMRPDDYECVSLPIPPGLYSGPEPPPGFGRRDGRGGTPLLPVYGDGDLETVLARRYAALRARYPGLRLERYAFRMPFWPGPDLPASEDYALVDAPERLVTTSVSVLLAPRAQVQDAAMGFFFQGDQLSSLRERMQGTVFRGITGNLGYYYTPGLIGNDPGWARPWAHNVRYPGFPLPTVLSYIGFHLSREGAAGEVYGSFLGANPAAVGIRRDGTVEVLSQLEIARYEVTLGGQRFAVAAIDDPHAAGQDVALFTPALRTVEVEQYIAATEAAGGAADGWQSYAAMVPLADAEDRIHVFVANQGDGRVPIEEAIAVWEGPSPVPSFGAVLSFKRAYFESLFGRAEGFRRHILGTRVQIVPHGGTPFDEYAQMLGGFVPAVVDGEHILCVDTARQALHSLSRYSSATSPIALAAQESRNFDLYIREPAGVVIQTDEHMGWVLFDGRHELSIGASVVDVGVLLHKLQAEGMLPAIDQAAFVDGGSAMKVYHVVSDEEAVQLDLLNRVAAGPRNRAGADPDGLNLYTTLALRLAGE